MLELITPVGLSNYRITFDNRAFSVIHGLHELSTRVGSNGYLSFTATFDSGMRKPVEFHRIIGLTVVHNPDNKPEINHIDGNKLNNHPSNLEWCTRKENEAHSYIAGLRAASTRAVFIKPVNGSDFDVMVSNGLRECARAFEIPVATLQSHLNRTPYRPLMGYYVWYAQDRVKADHIGRWKHS